MREIDLTVIHLSETHLQEGSARNCFESLLSSNDNGYHFIIDSNEIIQHSELDCVVKTSHGELIDPFAVHVLIFGQYSYNATKWVVNGAASMIDNLARVISDISRYDSLPIQWLMPEHLRKRDRGITSSKNITLAFEDKQPYSRCGRFPIKRLLYLSRNYYYHSSLPPPMEMESTMP